MSSVSGELAGELFVWSMIIGIGVATFLIRFAPIALLARLELPAWLTRALRYVPPAVMAAIIHGKFILPLGSRRDVAGGV
ncbi:MAG: AzlD domain-containing protein, partial [Candidatus Accumulibacter phosphatis]